MIPNHPFAALAHAGQHTPFRLCFAIFESATLNPGGRALNIEELSNLSVAELRARAITSLNY